MALRLRLFKTINNSYSEQLGQHDMSLLRQILLLAEEAESKDKEPEESDKESDVAEQPEEKPEEDSNEEENVEDEDDIATIVEKQGYDKSSKEKFAFGETRKVTVLTKTEPLGGLDVTYQYIINPKTGSWVLSACLAGQSDEDMVEFHSGEDTDSLIASLKKPQKISQDQAIKNLKPPADPSI